jgi:two-component sensor histidine kinase
VKHGALSGPTGVVSVSKAIDKEGAGGSFRLTWREAGGPPVGAVSRNGFGSFILLEFPKQFGGEATLDYSAGGLIYDLSLPLDAIRDKAPPAKPQE